MLPVWKGHMSLLTWDLRSSACVIVPCLACSLPLSQPPNSPILKHSAPRLPPPGSLPQARWFWPSQVLSQDFASFGLGGLDGELAHSLCFSACQISKRQWALEELSCTVKPGLHRKAPIGNWREIWTAHWPDVPAGLWKARMTVYTTLGGRIWALVAYTNVGPGLPPRWGPFWACVWAQPLKCWDYRCAPRHLAHPSFF
jgi:hypothetical protein